MSRLVRTLLLSAMLSGCFNYNRTEHMRVREELEQTGTVVEIRGDSAAVIGTLARERAWLWLRNNSVSSIVDSGGDTLRSERSSLTEFGYRIIRKVGPESLTFSVDQRSFGRYYGGLNSRRLAHYMATGIEIDTLATVSTRPRLTSLLFGLGGEGLFLSAHLERTLLPHLVGRVGVGYAAVNLLSGGDGGLVVPIGVSFVSSPETGIEVGFGVSTVFGLEIPPGDDRVVLSFPIGLRHAPAEGGFSLRFVLTPRYSFGARKLVVDRPAIGFGLGHTF